jgi:hypothetical protein
MQPKLSPNELSALSAHRFLMRAALAASASFAWVFALQYLYGLYGNLTEAFIKVILLYELAQVITILVTPYSAKQLVHGIRGRMMAGVVVCILALLVFGGMLSGLFNAALSLVCFAIFIGVYRAMYWTPYVLERQNEISGAQLPHEIFIAVMPAIAGYVLINGPFGAAMLLFAAASILIASLAPLFKVPEMYERFSWGYRETFAELFEPKYNAIIEPSFVEGLQATALLLLWPLSVFIIVGLSYKLMGLVITATLLLTILIRSRGQRVLEKKDLLHATMRATSWLLRLVVASPVAVVAVAAYAAPTDASVDMHTLEQAADNGTYLDEYTVLKEITQGLGRIAMCIVASVCISVFSLPVGLAVTFILAAAASLVSFLYLQQVAHN